MKIKLDFVTNSSTTSFVVAADGELTKERLGELMGVPVGSPLEPMVDGLFAALEREATAVPAGIPPRATALADVFRGEIPEHVLRKVEEARARGWAVWAGRLQSDIDWTELLFCADSFEWENEHLYINGLECAW